MISVSTFVTTMRARKKIIRIRVSDNEYKQIHHHATVILELDISKYLRELALTDIKKTKSPEL